MPILSFKSFLEQDVNAMREIVLPMTLKGIHACGQEYMEKFCRHYVQKRFNAYMASHSGTQTERSIGSEAPLNRFVNELAAEAPNGKLHSENFCHSFRASEEAVALLYDNTV